MNILHMRYAVEVANAGSVNEAAKDLLVVPSSLSRSIKELEDSLGVALFVRSPRGMVLTPEGEGFIHYAKEILSQIDELENTYRAPLPVKQSFSISVPRASYIAEAFARFSTSITAEPAEIYYQETDASRAIKNLLETDCRLAIVRYEVGHDRYFRKFFQENGLVHKAIADFRYVLIMSEESVLAGKKGIRLADLRPLIEIAHAAPPVSERVCIPSLPKKPVPDEWVDDLSDGVERHIFVFERGSQFDLLAENPETFMWGSPVPDKLLRRCHLTQKECEDTKKNYKDVLVHHKDYALTELDRRFIAEVHNSRRRLFRK